LKTIKNNFSDLPFTYYVEKFQRRIYRRMLEFETLKNNLSKDMGESSLGAKVQKLLSLDDNIVKNFEIKDHIEKATLTGLKAEFELFFTIYCNLVLDHLIKLIEEKGMLPEEHKGILTIIDDKKKFFDDFVKSGFKNERRLIIDLAVPSHGLDRLEKLLTNCGWKDVEILKSESGEVLGSEYSSMISNPWTQICMAFQVRHAIEHSFSKVGNSFLFKTKDIWDHSTWQRWWSDSENQSESVRTLAKKEGLNTAPSRGERIFIDRTDICGTAAAMSWAANQLLKKWPVKQ
jgi:hypothetical protein